jgi:LysM repeat protein
MYRIATVEQRGYGGFTITQAIEIMRTHKVREGDTITSIAKLFDVAKEDLATENHLTNINLVRKDQVLKIPVHRQRSTAEIRQPERKDGKEETVKKPKTVPDLTDEWQKRVDMPSTSWLNSLLQILRTTEANEYVQQTERIPLTRDARTAAADQAPPQKKNSKSSRKFDDIKAELRERLDKEPHIIQMLGVKLTRNERKQLIAAVATCEMNGDGFGTVNPDTEFIGRKFGAKGAETSYSRIVHIGLSYGVIQYTQDSGVLGGLLSRMSTVSPAKFTEIFGGGDITIANSLVSLTTSGHPDLLDNSNVPLSGQTYWRQVRRNAVAQETYRMANARGGSILPTAREIRGKRVQKLVPSHGAPAIDIWEGVWKERFLAAGQILDFQEAQLDYAVDEYFNKILKKAKNANVRSALGLAFLAACAVRGGPNSDLSRLLYRVAEAAGITLPFSSSLQEKSCVEAISRAVCPRGSTICELYPGVFVDHEEIRRATLLMKDELGFLAEDLYDTSTYL